MDDDVEIPREGFQEQSNQGYQMILRCFFSFSSLLALVPTRQSQQVFYIVRKMAVSPNLNNLDQRKRETSLQHVYIKLHSLHWGYALRVVYSLGLDKCIMICTHHYN